MLCCILTTNILISVLHVAVTPPKSIEDDLEGTWVLQSYTNEGVKKLGSDPTTTFHDQRVLIEKDEWIEWYSGGDSLPDPKTAHLVFKFMTRPGIPFRQLDYWVVDQQGKPDTWKKVGIYRLNDGKLEFCFRVQEIGGKPVKRPSKFRAGKGEGTGLAVFTRLKPNR